MPYIAQKTLPVQRGGRKIVHVQPGDPVPEAETWWNRDKYVASGHLVWVPNEAEKRTKLAKADEDKPKAKKKTKRKRKKATKKKPAKQRGDG